jgi:hypothetical protein
MQPQLLQQSLLVLPLTQPQLLQPQPQLLLLPQNPNRIIIKIIIQVQLFPNTSFSPHNDDLLHTMPLIIQWLQKA